MILCRFSSFDYDLYIKMTVEIVKWIVEKLGDAKSKGFRIGRRRFIG